MVVRRTHSITGFGEIVLVENGPAEIRGWAVDTLRPARLLIAFLKGEIDLRAAQLGLESCRGRSKLK